MQREEWLRIAKWVGYVYAPIVLLVVGIFIYITWGIN